MRRTQAAGHLEGLVLVEAPGQVEHRQLPVCGATEQRRRGLVPERHLQEQRTAGLTGGLTVLGQVPVI